MVELNTHIPDRRGDYGIDGDFRVVSARGQAAIIAVILVVLLAVTVGAAVAGLLIVAVVAALAGLVLALSVASYLWTTRVGKFQVWAEILADLELRGDERVLDLGCGRGAVLLMAAQLLPQGRAVGIDLWRADQTGNGPEVTRRNAEREGVAGRVEVLTGDVTRLPFDDNTFDVVVSSLVLHNIDSASDRQTAVDEAVRTLRPGGRLVIADLLATGTYRDRLQALGISDVRQRNLGWRMWWLGPLMPTRLVTATKPPA